MASRPALLALLLALCCAPANAQDVLLPPPNAISCPDCPPLGFLFAPGASINPSQYRSLAADLQTALALHGIRLWAAIAHCPEDICLDVSDPFPGVQGALERVWRELTGGSSKLPHFSRAAAANFSTFSQASMSAMTRMPADAPLVLAGHSLGGAMLQEAVPAIVAKDSNSPLATLTRFQVLMGSFLTRNVRDSYYKDVHGVPTLTLGGELDGLCRVTRMAEARYHTVDPASRFPVLVLSGLNHMSFASGVPPTFVRDNDLRAEVNDTVAHQRVVQATASFLLANWRKDKAAAAAVARMAAETDVFVRPMLDSMELEGSKFLKPWCQTLKLAGNRVGHATTRKGCFVGCPWSESASAVGMFALDKERVVVDDKDQFHYVYDIDPVHLPAVLGNCSAPTPSCTLETSSVTQAVYQWEESWVDSGFFREAATELRTKLVSRQAAWTAVGKTPANFNATDETLHNCANINRQAYAWALKQSGASAGARFKKYGVPLEFGKDEPHVTGPTWIWSSLKYLDGTTPGGDPAIVVRSPSMAEPLDSWIHAAAGKHYCKVLSPAYAIEWMYIDGLRLRLGSH
jgi:hypothetical protein